MDPFAPEGTYELQNLQTEVSSAETADALMRDLAKAGLISEFDSWGQTARYYEVQKLRSESGLTYHSDTDVSWTAVEDYLRAQGLDWTVVKHDYYYQITPKETCAFETEFALAADLYEAYDLQPEYLRPESITNSVLGANSLAVDGDINLDCNIDIADTVLLARFIAEDQEIEITGTGIGNGDLDKDGSVTMSDVSVLLRQLANLD